MSTVVPENFYQGRRVLVTGGAGFIGSHLARSLAGLGAEVTVIDDLSNGDWASLGEKSNSIRQVEASVLDAEALAGAMAGCEVVFHEAALASVPASLEDPERYHDVNVTGLLRVLQSARASRARRVVFASSSSVYGDQPGLPKRETQLPDPISPYAQQKLAGEHMLRVWAKNFGMEAVSLRYFNIFGPGQRADSAYAAVVAAFATTLLDGRRPTIFGDGGATRDFTYVQNVVEANLRAGFIHWDRSPGDALPDPLAGGVANIACGAQVSVLELEAVMAEVVGARIEPIFDPPRAGDVLHSVADIDRARKWFDYEPTVGLQEGLRHTIAWYRGIHRR